MTIITPAELRARLAYVLDAERAPGALTERRDAYRHVRHDARGLKPYLTPGEQRDQIRALVDELSGDGVPFTTAWLEVHHAQHSDLSVMFPARAPDPQRHRRQRRLTARASP